MRQQNPMKSQDARTPDSRNRNPRIQNPRFRTAIFFTVVFAAAALLLTACGGDDDNNSTDPDATVDMTADNGMDVEDDTGDDTEEDTGDDTEEDTGDDTEEDVVETRMLGLEFTGLPDLGADYVYEGWMMVDGAPVTTGRFTVDAEGNLDPATFELDAAMADVATAFILTIEPAEGDDPAPSDTHVVAGPFDTGAAALTIGHEAALGDDFTNAMGGFILATPSTSMDDTDNANGIWFLDPSGQDPVASLDLPELPAGWVYEGWVVDVSGDSPMPVTTGTFTAVDMADSNDGGPAAGDDMTPPFPGEDFIDPATDLTADHMAVISIEPDPDNSPMPFQLKPLAGMIGTDTAPTVQSLGNAIGDNNITGTATLQ